MGADFTKDRKMDGNKIGKENAEFPADMKKTKQREIIFRTLTRESGAVSVAEIYDSLARTMGCGKLAVSTVYRALSAFEARGYVTKSTLMGEDTAYYEWNKGTHRHYAVCLNCHKLIPLRSCPFEHAGLEADAEDFTVTGHKLELYGYCSGCKGKETRRKE